MNQNDLFFQLKQTTNAIEEAMRAEAMNERKALITALAEIQAMLSALAQSFDQHQEDHPT